MDLIGRLGTNKHQEHQDLYRGGILASWLLLVGYVQTQMKNQKHFLGNNVIATVDQYYDGE